MVILSDFPSNSALFGLVKKMTPEMPVDGLKDQKTPSFLCCNDDFMPRTSRFGLSGTFLPCFKLSSGYTADGSQNPAMMVACLSSHYLTMFFCKLLVLRC